MGIVDTFPTRAEGALCAGQRLFDEKSYREAEAAFVLAHTIEPRAEEPLLGLCRVSYATQNWRDLDRWTRRLLEIQPGSIDGQLLRARVCNALRQWQPAAVAWAIVTRHYPDWAEPPFQLARALYRGGDAAGADRAAACLAAMVPRTARHIDLLCQLSLERGHCEEAAVFFTALAEQAQEAAWHRFEAAANARQHRGVAIMGRAVLEAAPGPDSRQALAIRSAMAEALHELAARAVTAERTNNLDEAFQNYTAILIADPADVLAERGRARIQRTLRIAAHNALRLQDWERAIEDFQRLVQLDGSDIDSRIQLGRLFMRRRDWPAALSLWPMVIAARPGLVEGHLQLARAHGRSGDHSAALPAWSKVLALCSDNAEAREMLRSAPRQLVGQARGLIDAGNLAKAAETLMLARSLAPHDIDIAQRTDHMGRRLLQAMRAAFKEADWQAILDIGAAARALRPDDADVHLLTGRAAMARRLYAIAIPAWTRLAELDPAMQSMCRLQLARCHLRSGQHETARATIAEILARDPGHVEAQMMLARL